MALSERKKQKFYNDAREDPPICGCLPGGVPMTQGGSHEDKNSLTVTYWCHVCHRTEEVVYKGSNIGSYILAGLIIAAISSKD